MKIDKFIKDITPFYFNLLENVGLEEAQEFVREQFVKYYIQELNEDELLMIVEELAKDKFDEMKVINKLNDYNVKNYDEIKEKNKLLNNLKNMIGELI